MENRIDGLCTSYGKPDVTTVRLIEAPRAKRWRSALSQPHELIRLQLGVKSQMY